MSKGWTRGSTRRWREKIRPAVLDRDGHRCRMGDPTHPIGRTQPRSDQCEWTADYPPHQRGPLHVHHTLGRNVTGDEDPRYLITSCGPCNLAIGDPTQQPDPAPTPRTRW
jgi:hypothetical protein